MTNKQLSFKQMIEELELQGFGRVENTPESEYEEGLNIYSADLMIPEEDKEYEVVMVTYLNKGKEEVGSYKLYENSAKEGKMDNGSERSEFLTIRQWKRFENELNHIYDTIQNYLYKIDDKYSYLTSQFDTERIAKEIGRL